MMILDGVALGLHPFDVTLYGLRLGDSKCCGIDCGHDRVFQFVALSNAPHNTELMWENSTTWKITHSV